MRIAGCGAMSRSIIGARTKRYREAVRRGQEYASLLRLPEKNSWPTRFNEILSIVEEGWLQVSESGSTATGVANDIAAWIRSRDRNR